MKKVRVVVLSMLMMLLGSWLGYAQQSVATAGVGMVPPLIQFSNIATDEGGSSLSGEVSITFSLYNGQQGGEPLWIETQNNVQLDPTGHYSVQLGITKPAGVPTALFTTAEARWLGVRIGEQAEQSRVLLLSVPYALKAGDAATIGGLPPSAFVLAASGTAANDSVITNSAAAQSSAAAVSGTGKKNYIPLWLSASKLGSSILFQTGGNVGVGTTTPAATLDVNGTSNVEADNVGQAVTITQNNVNGNGLIATAPFVALAGTATNSSGVGVSGSATATGVGASTGVGGSASTDSGVGVSGVNITGANGFGVYGFVRGTSAIGVFGQNQSGTSGIGVEGLGTAPTGIGVEGLADDLTGTGEPIGVEGLSYSSVGVGVLGNANSTTGSTIGVQGTVASATGIGIQGLSPNIGVEGNAEAAGGSFPIGVHGIIDSSAGAAAVFDNPARTILNVCTGNLIIGRTYNTLVGIINVFRVDCTGKGYFDNGTQTGGADFAESVTIRGSRSQYAPGDLLVIDSRGKRRLALSQQAYSTRIAGIYSTKPGVLATPHKMDDSQLA